MFCVMVWLREGGSSILRGGFLDGGGGGRRMRVFSAVVLFVRKKNCRSIRFVHVAVSLGLYEERGLMNLINLIFTEMSS